MSDGEGAQGGAEGTQSGAGDLTDSNVGSTDPGTSGGAQSGTTQQPTEAETLKSQLEQQRQRTLASDQRAAKIEAELKQLRDKDLPEIEKLKRDFEDTVKQRDSLKDSVNQLALDNAFLKENSVTWHSPETALKLVDRSQVTIDDDGTVHGMKEALTALAKSNPYLVKTETTETAPPPGTAPANNGSSGTAKPKPGAMAGRLPVLRTRVKPQ